MPVLKQLLLFFRTQTIFEQFILKIKLYSQNKKIKKNYLQFILIIHKIN